MICPDCEKMARHARELLDQMAVIIQQVAIVARERDEALELLRLDKFRRNPDEP